jgi:hypothetical protein
METYSYDYLFELIRTQAKIDSESRGGGERQRPTFLGTGLRTINNPTSQNLMNMGQIVMDTIVPPTPPPEPDDTNRYLYVHNR